MKITLKETCESDGNWYKVYVDDFCKACIKKDTIVRTNDQALEKAKQIFQFYYENGGQDKVLMEFEVTEADLTDLIRFK